MAAGEGRKHRRNKCARSLDLFDESIIVTLFHAMPTGALS